MHQGSHQLIECFGCMLPQNFSEKFKILITYVIKVYAPNWYNIKTHIICKDEARHLWTLISSSRQQIAEQEYIIDPVIERNCYFAHTDNLLLSMLTDFHAHIRKLQSIRCVLKHRQAKSNPVEISELPKINFNASNVYYELTDR